MTKRRTHLDATRGEIISRGLCGSLGGVVSTERGAVTCKLCVRRLLQQAQSPELRNEYSHAGAFLAATERPLPTHSNDPNVKRLWVEVFRGIADLIVPSDAPRAGLVIRTRTTPFASTRHALAEWVGVRLHGYGQRSIADPRRLEQMAGALGSSSTSGSRDDPAQKRADSLVHVEAALEAAFVRPWDDVDFLTPDLCRLIFVLRHVARDREERALSGIEVAEQVGARLPEDQRARITPSLVARIASHGYDVVSRELERRQLIEPDEQPAERAEDERMEPGLLRGWGSIALYLKVGITTAKRMSNEGMPTYWFRGVVEAKESELDEWVKSIRIPRSGPHATNGKGKPR